MPQIRTRQLLGNSDIPGVYGSRRASVFLRDAIAGTDSIDVMVIGDSNAGYFASSTAASGQGYTVGVGRALQSLNIPIYATPLIPAGKIGGGNGWAAGMLSQNTGTYIAGSNYGTPSTGMRQLDTAAAAADADAVGLKTHLGYNSSNLPITFGIINGVPSFVASTVTYTSSFPNNISISGASMLSLGSSAGGVACQYRLVHGTFVTSGGKYRLCVLNTSSVLQTGSSADIPTSGGYGYSTGILPFNAPKSGSTPLQYICTWDGYSQTATYKPTGPFAAIYHSVIRTSYKGYSVSNFCFESGATAAQINTKLSDSSKMLESFLYELRTRQIAASGTGRVIVWGNWGVNGPETPTTWGVSSSNIVATIRNLWIGLGYPETDLAFVFSVTHPVPGSSWGALYPAANEWATTNASLGVTVGDISQFFTSDTLTARGLYNFNVSTFGADTSHLRPMVTTLMPTAINLYPASSGFIYAGYDCDISNFGYGIVATKLLTAVSQYY